MSIVTVAGPDPAEWAAVDRLIARGVDVHAVRRMIPRGIDRWHRRWRLAGTWLRGREPFRTTWYREAEVQTLLHGLLRHNDFDVVDVEDNAMGIYRYPTTAPVVFNEHEVRRPRPVSLNGWSLRNSLRWAAGEWDWSRWPRYHREVWERFQRIQVFTERDAAALRSIAPHLSARIHVNPFGIEMPEPVDPRMEQAGTVLFSGAFHHPPNRDAALWLTGEIMPRLRKREASVRLVLAGSLPPESVKALATSDVVVAGDVPSIRPFFEQATVVVAPIRTGGGMRMKVLQAMAMGKPVVTTRRGAEGLDFFGESPPLLVADDAKGIADAVAELLNSSERRRELAGRARGFVAQHFSEDAYARRLEAIYDQAIQSRSSAVRRPSA